jgi:hypothetical protein
MKKTIAFSIRDAFRIHAKRTLLSLSLLFTVVIASAGMAYDPDPENEEVIASFKKEFPGATMITWSEDGELVKANFIFGGYSSEAYFSPEGELLGCVRSIVFSQLPLAVTQSIKRLYADAQVLQVNEITNGNGTRYYLRLETKTRKYKVQMDAGGNLVDVEKQKK